MKIAKRTKTRTKVLLAGLAAALFVVLGIAFATFWEFAFDGYMQGMSWQDIQGIIAVHFSGGEKVHTIEMPDGGELSVPLPNGSVSVGNSGRVYICRSENYYQAYCQRMEQAGFALDFTMCADLYFTQTEPKRYLTVYGDALSKRYVRFSIGNVAKG
jgi:hypothetical protein